MIMSSITTKKKDEKLKPTFIFRYISARQWRKIAELNDRFFAIAAEDVKADAAEDLLNIPFDVIRKLITGWRNLKGIDGKTIDFDPDKLDDILTQAEAIELMIASMQQIPSVEDKKKLDSPSCSSTEQSAKTVKEPQTAKEK